MSGKWVFNTKIIKTELYHQMGKQKKKRKQRNSICINYLTFLVRREWKKCTVCSFLSLFAQCSLHFAFWHMNFFNMRAGLHVPCSVFHFFYSFIFFMSIALCNTFIYPYMRCFLCFNFYFYLFSKNNYFIAFSVPPTICCARRHNIKEKIEKEEMVLHTKKCHH